MALTINRTYTYTKPLDTVYVDSEGNVIDPDVPSARGTIQLPEATVATPDWKDVVRRYSIASNDNLWTNGTGKFKNIHLKKQAEEGAAKYAAGAKENPGLETIGLVAGAAPFAVAATPAIVGGGELAYPILTNPYVDAGITSAFAGHGLNHAINEGIDSWGDAAMTALEIAPLGRVARPMWNAVKSTGNFIPTLESNMSGVRYAYNRNPELANIGTLEDYNDYLKTVFPESKVRDINYHMGPKGLQELKPSTGKVYNTNPDARGIYVTPDKSYAQRLRKYTTDRLEKPSFFTYIKRNLIPGGWDKANDVFTDIYPVMVDTKNPLLTKGTWTWGIKDKKYQSLMDDYDAIVNSGPKWYQNFNSMPETIVPKTEQSLILGSDADVAGFRRFMSNPQITAENAASITPEQWDAAYMDAVSKEDMTEIQRLVGLYAHTKGYNPKLPLYHGSAEKNITVFDPDAKPVTLEGSGGTTFFTSNFDAADVYAKAKGILDMKHDPGRVYKVYAAYNNPKIVNYDGAAYDGIGYSGVLDDFVYENVPILNNNYKYFNSKVPFPFSYRPGGDTHKVLTIEGPTNTQLKYLKFTPHKVAGSTSEEAAKGIQEGHDVVILKGVDEGIGPQGRPIGPIDDYAIRDSRIVKLADPITYDNAGSIIPLSKRYDKNKFDIRYGLLPFLGLGAAGTLYKN